MFIVYKNIHNFKCDSQIVYLMKSTIQISKELLKELKSMKMHDKESYEDIIWDLIEDRLEFSEETKKTIKEYEKDVKEGNFNKFTSFENVKRKLGIN